MDGRCVVLAAALTVLRCRPGASSNSPAPDALRDAAVLVVPADAAALDLVVAAVNASDEIIKDSLKSPANARFSEHRIVERSERYFYLTSTVEAPNAMGVILRSHWCVILGFESDKADDYVWSHTQGSWQCDEEPRARELILRKASSGWPGADVRMMTILVGRKEATNLLSWIDHLAAVTGVPASDLRKWSNGFLASGASSADVEKYVAAVLDATVRTGDPEHAERAAAAMVHFIASERLSENDLADLGVVPAALRDVPRLKAMTDSRLKAEAASGRLSANELFMAIAGGPKKQLGAIFMATHPRASPDAGRAHD